MPINIPLKSPNGAGIEYSHKDIDSKDYSSDDSGCGFNDVNNDDSEDDSNVDNRSDRNDVNYNNKDNLQEYDDIPVNLNNKKVMMISKKKMKVK